MAPFGLGAIEKIGVPHHLAMITLKPLNMLGIPFPHYLAFIPEVRRPGVGEFVLPFRPGVSGPHVKPDGIDRYCRGRILLEYFVAYPTGAYGTEGSSWGEQKDKARDAVVLIEKVLQLLNIVKFY